MWPIAGLKEKLLAALRGGIKTVLIPEENAKDLVEISDTINQSCHWRRAERRQSSIRLARLASPCVLNPTHE